MGDDQGFPSSTPPTPLEQQIRQGRWVQDTELLQDWMGTPPQACPASVKVPGQPVWTAHCQLLWPHAGLHRNTYPVTGLDDDVEGTVTLEWAGDWQAVARDA